TWLPIPPEWAALTVDKQLNDTHSTLSFFRQALELRRSCAEFDGGAIEWLSGPADTLIFKRCAGGLICALNAGARRITVPDGEVILASAPVVDGTLPPNAAAWLV
ncbi:MAG: DUF3459 domain-containing protein, partial [Mycobacterium sp.]|nr:DUF3459 domain-containing protein [Mycobacterium sp.]